LISEETKFYELEIEPFEIRIEDETGFNPVRDAYGDLII